MVVCLVAGATGATGVHIVAELLRMPAVEKILLLNRRPWRELEKSTAELWKSTGKVDEKLIWDEWDLWNDAQWRSSLARSPSVVPFLHGKAGSAASTPLEPDDEDTVAALRSTMTGDGVNIVFTALGTSRANSEVKADMAAAAAETGHQGPGFERWLSEVDYRRNYLLARAANVPPAKAPRFGPTIFSRISAANANATADVVAEKTFSYYSRYQGLADEAVARALSGGKMIGHILRPGALDRGDEFRAKREWEVARNATQGPGLSVVRLAKVAVHMALSEYQKKTATLEDVKRRPSPEEQVVYVDEATIRGYDLSQITYPPIDVEHEDEEDL
ncbi:unnamed protein product [Amoebophrya sp. A25]|nr:unnamed protein product [Amoebophrya sp. A25]|eukprot:GSA25T00005387001.1